jgi:hypothetical protein
MGDDGIERVPTQTVFDTLEVPQRSRGAGPAGAWRNSCVSWGGLLSKRGGLTQSGLRDQVRGYARDKTGLSQY